MRTASKLAAIVAGLVAAGGVGAFGVVAFTAEPEPEVVTLQSGSASATPVPATRQLEEGDDRPLRPGEARRAREAALRVTGGGTVSEVDRSDDPGESYEVEVLKDGREHDIALDLDFEPVQNRRYDD